MTYLWQEERGIKFYKVQTDEIEISQKLFRRNGLRLSMIGLNCVLWIFNCEFTRPDIARKVLKSVTSKNAKIDSEGIICFS